MEQALTAKERRAIARERKGGHDVLSKPLLVSIHERGDESDIVPFGGGSDGSVVRKKPRR